MLLINTAKSDSASRWSHQQKLAKYTSIIFKFFEVHYVYTWCISIITKNLSHSKLDALNSCKYFGLGPHLSSPFICKPHKKYVENMTSQHAVTTHKPQPIIQHRIGLEAVTKKIVTSFVKIYNFQFYLWHNKIFLEKWHYKRKIKIHFCMLTWDS